MESRREHPNEWVSMEQRFADFGKVISTFQRERGDRKRQLFDRSLRPLLEALMRRIQISAKREVLHEQLLALIDDSPAGAELWEMIAENEDTENILVLPPVHARQTEVSPRPPLEDNDDNLPTQEPIRAKHVRPSTQDAYEGSFAAKRAAEDRDAERQFKNTHKREAGSLLMTPEVQVHETPAFHEALFGEPHAFRRLTVEDIFGRTIRPEETASKNLEAIRVRLERIQRSRSSSELVEKTLRAIEEFLRVHRDAIRAPHLIEGREKFPNDDTVDALLRGYLTGLVDWYAHVYNGRLDTWDDLQHPRAAREQLRYFLKDGLSKALNTVTRQFPYESGLGGQLDSLISRTIDEHYYEQRKSVA